MDKGTVLTVVVFIAFDNCEKYTSSPLIDFCTCTVGISTHVALSSTYVFKINICPWSPLTKQERSGSAYQIWQIMKPWKMFWQCCYKTFPRGYSFQCGVGAWMSISTECCSLMINVLWRFMSQSPQNWCISLVNNYSTVKLLTTSAWNPLAWLSLFGDTCLLWIQCCTDDTFVAIHRHTYLAIMWLYFNLCGGLYLHACCIIK